MAEWLKQSIPPLVKTGVKAMLAKPLGLGRFTGPYASWEQAKTHSQGYDSDIILKQAITIYQQAQSSPGSFERDGVLIEDKSYPYPMLAHLLTMMLQAKRRLRVVDFGGGLASVYYQLSSLLGTSPTIDWYVLEQPHIVEKMRQLNREENVHYLHALTDGPGQYDVLVLSGVLQYLEHPIDMLGKLNLTQFQSVIIDRLPMIKSGAHQLVVQHVPSQHYKASYPSWLFDKSTFFDWLVEYGQIHDTFDAIDGVVETLTWKVSYQGVVLKTQ